MSRITGWAAHRIEELNFDSKRIIRPAYRNVGPEQKFIPMDKRGQAKASAQKPHSDNRKRPVGPLFAFKADRDERKREIV